MVAVPLGRVSWFDDDALPFGARSHEDPMVLIERAESWRELLSLTGGRDEADIRLLDSATLDWIRHKVILAGFAIRNRRPLAQNERPRELKSARRVTAKIRRRRDFRQIRDEDLRLSKEYSDDRHP